MGKQHPFFPTRSSWKKNSSIQQDAGVTDAQVALTAELGEGLDSRIDESCYAQTHQKNFIGQMQTGNLQSFDLVSRKMRKSRVFSIQNQKKKIDFKFYMDE